MQPYSRIPPLPSAAPKPAASPEQRTGQSVIPSPAGPGNGLRPSYGSVDREKEREREREREREWQRGMFGHYLLSYPDRDRHVEAIQLQQRSDTSQSSCGESEHVVILGCLPALPRPAASSPPSPSSPSSQWPDHEPIRYVSVYSCSGRSIQPKCADDGETESRVHPRLGNSSPSS